MKNDISMVFNATFWKEIWTQSAHSFLAEHQKRCPDRWFRFYEKQGRCLREISGINKRQGRGVVELFLRHGLLSSNESVVDLGCGSGWLALPLALEGIRVQAVDTSSGMLEALQRQAMALKSRTLEIKHACWTELEPDEPFDLVLAACFPPALSPEGISRMEWLGKKCALLLPNGDQGIPWIKNLWRALFRNEPEINYPYAPSPFMEMRLEGKVNGQVIKDRFLNKPHFSGSRQLQTAVNYLLAAGRNPGLIPITIPLLIDLPIQQVLDFYVEYFSLFDKSGPKNRLIIERELLPFVDSDRVMVRGESHYGLIWWGGRP